MGCFCICVFASYWWSSWTLNGAGGLPHSHGMEPLSLAPGACGPLSKGLADLEAMWSLWWSAGQGTGQVAPWESLLLALCLGAAVLPPPSIPSTHHQGVSALVQHLPWTWSLCSGRAVAFIGWLHLVQSSFAWVQQMLCFTHCMQVCAGGGEFWEWNEIVIRPQTFQPPLWPSTNSDSSNFLLPYAPQVMLR